MFVNAGAHYVALDFIAIKEAGGDLRVMAEQVRRDPTILRDTTKSDAVATSLREAVKLCLGEAHKSQELPRSDLQHAAASADAA